MGVKRDDGVAIWLSCRLGRTFEELIQFDAGRNTPLQRRAPSEEDIFCSASAFSLLCVRVGGI